MSRKPTGRLVEDSGVSRLVMHRTFRAPDRGRLGFGHRVRTTGAMDRFVHRGPR